MRDGRSSVPLFFVGLLLLVSAGLIAPVVGTQTYLPRLLLLGGGLAVGWGAVRSARRWIAVLHRVRRTSEPGPARVWLLGGLLLLLVSVGLGLQGARWDLSRRGLNSLSPVSRQVLSRPGREVEMIAAYREAHPAAAQAREILRLYRSGVKGVRTRTLDPERDPETARRLGVGFVNGILIRADSVSEVVETLTEEAITTAILRARDPRRVRLALLEGHGESAPGRAGFAELRRLAEQSGVQLLRLDLRVEDEVPPDLRGVIVAGPQSPLLPGEIAALRRFLDRGGRLGVFLDPEAPSGLEPLLSAEGIRVDGRRIRDDGPLTSSVRLGPETIAVQSLGDHEITRGLTSAVVLRGATRVALPAVAVLGRDGVDLLKSAPSARLIDRASTEGVAGAGERAGIPLPLAACSEWPARSDGARPAGSDDSPDDSLERRAARLLVVGDSDLLRDDTLGLYGNRAFASRLLSWLSAREFLIDFPEVDRGGSPLHAGLARYRAVFAVVEVLLPLAMLGLGLLVWWRRR